MTFTLPSRHYEERGIKAHAETGGGSRRRFEAPAQWPWADADLAASATDRNVRQERRRFWNVRDEMRPGAQAIRRS